MRDWEESYQGAPPPWDIGRPQPRFAELQLAGRVIDVGCGTGEHTLFAAKHGADALGVDISTAAIALAREKARERGIEARFDVLDAFDLPTLGETFDIALDMGVYHVFDEVGTRERYAATVREVLDPGAVLHLMCFSERTPGDWGPQRIREDELRSTFDRGWELVTLERSTIEINPGFPASAAQAWYVLARRR
ncbi:MAG TPA: class I SAM-dependent methyltransferase [Gaiellaceae bacterium]|nr:class I SAM-dependent methyltransferase [Gaiellaceae bacterium]